jgi:gluconate 5-dehydrogenase/2-deoxy-D-gluconate 3-dehydrogenase
MGGAHVAICDIDETLGSKTAATIRAMGRESFSVRCDVTDPVSVREMVEAVVSRFGRLDIAVNNAGIFRYGDDENMAKDDWDAVLNVNLTGTWSCAQAEMRQMKCQQPVAGKIINIASIAATMASSNGCYDASKAAVVHLTRTLAARWGRYNINVNCISPGYVVSALGTTRSLDERQRIRDVTPLGHVQRLEDLYGPVLFLASRASDYITGQNLIVDGGHTLNTWFVPLERDVPPRVDPAGEVVEMKRDLQARGVKHDIDGIILE